MFTFLSLTYNHQDYVIEHLESIKYQIVTYGIGREIQLIIADDASKDNTRELIQQWLDKNGNLFTQIDLLFNEENLGIVRNVINGFNKIDGDSFKLLAGDDLYNVYNIFAVDELYEYDVAGSYPIALTGNEVHRKLTEYYNYKHTKVKGKSKKYFARQLRLGYGLIVAPAIFYKVDLVKDKQLQEYMLNYKHIEDQPMWYYIFNIKKTNIVYKDIEKPYVIYRTSSGISQNTKHEFNNEFTEERTRMFEDMCSKAGLVNRKYRILERKIWIVLNFKKKYGLKISKKMQRDYKEHLKERAESQQHILYINEKAREFKKDGEKILC